MNLFRRVSSQSHFSKITKRSFKYLKSPNESLEPPLTHGIHVFHCPDAVGIVAKLSECIASRGGNILGADIFVPENKNVFYSRSDVDKCHVNWDSVTNYILLCDEVCPCNKKFGIMCSCSEFVFDPCKWPREQIAEDFLTLAKTFNALRSIVRVPNLDPKYKIAVLASKQDHCLVDLLHAWQNGRLPVDITCVISNHDRGPDTHVIRFLEHHQIPYHYLRTTAGNKRDDEILALVQDTDFLVLARYMQILSGDFLKRYGRDIINIHHGLLPSFKGGHPAKQAFDYGVKLIGATSHFVTEELDAGPIIEQMVEAVSHRDNLQSFIQKSENLEKQCLSKAIKYYCELRVLPYLDNKTVVF
ncbi:hypothetical protein Cgig2_005245 [Carnegiea gigantea]|uniref:Formyl transferase N-terminal domain-containing protein n=1 Tax=Carnegiea gigantea TaxID=171969 RepID=A0A9Q1QCF3_9CARY|nr:hypothetical protein Cgig2_005245 [Carnegiea gigantea]